MQRLRQTSIVAACVAAILLTPSARGADAITPAEARKAWKHGHLEYERMPLKILIPSINLYSQKPIILASDSVGDLRVSGIVFDKFLADWVRALPFALPVVLIEGDDRIVICMRKRDPIDAPPK
jgi:transmembrane sensor